MSLRKRQEIQEMSRRTVKPPDAGKRRRFAVAAGLAIACWLPVPAQAAIWPETLGAFHRTSDRSITPAGNQAIWEEYGLHEAESADYDSGAQKFTGTAYRLQDPTGALGAFDMLRP